MRPTSTTQLKMLLLLAMALPASLSMAETIKIPVGQQTLTSEIQRPTLGMSKESVEKQFGSPAERVAPKGKPPISRWVYDDFIVYFEFDTVIHSVIKHQPQPEG